ncbi:MAG: ATPase components of ABC transporters with duplicated ATPase domains [Chloroflexi bacterium AL-W]|nr:ATPase components of ABC transporters with duplicated ATPase domains [Chloroflexi bacterium AL-N1]NOK66483.1 ATPase components of ABC transporters with duplicated ATPase domains [Chloroflexi bacterium AL-N10]NOK71871.1 ATPase components of ABC transporter with duplicated ATPase domains [Chloroflexi bacterium AL-N5]NOK81128.1 ATPase components of ABC transporters with duplicated ATPase domains [Chloroflexi bacterium AL-W]NOK89401.1 ATPase components of ABC transporters with duplicated ATPase 
MTEQIIYSMVRVKRVFPPNREVIRDISLSFFYGAKIGILGLNGSGKSTLLRIMAGIDQDYFGETMLSSGYTVGLLEQEPHLDPDKTVKQVVEEAVQPVVDMLAEYEAVNERFADPDADIDALVEEQARLQEALDRVDAWNLDGRLAVAMDALRCPPSDMPINVLSGGERRRIALCRLLLTEPDILLLDEPTNHLDAESVLWLEQHLQQYRGTVIAVTHDRYFLDNVAGWILELDRGFGVPWKGNYSSWLEQKQARLAKEEKADAKRRRTLEHELEWIRMTPKARQAKSKARITAYESLLNQETEERRENLEIYIPPGPRLGDRVIELSDVTKTFTDRLLIENMTLSIPPGSIIGIIGPNGAGKTTLLRLLAGQENPDAGTIAIGDTVQLTYVEQMRDILDGERTVWEEISGDAEMLQLGKRTMNSRAYVSSFNFMGADQQKKVGTLSGGERNRVLLAKMLKEGANVLLLDEPTNDLDVNTLRALEEALEAFAGCAIVVSHDRWFLDRIATHILAFEGESQLTWFHGNFAEYEEDRRKRLGQAADQPHRITYKKLHR